MDQLSRDLEEHRWAADLAISDLARKHGKFRAKVNGYQFNGASDWFATGNDVYWDCPDLKVAKKRPQEQ